MTQSILHQLPQVRGRYLEEVPLSRSTWFQVGGPAQVTYKPADLKDLQFFLKERPRDIPIHIIGLGSNLLVRDRGIRGVVIRLGSGFTNMYSDGITMHLGAAAMDRNVAMASIDAEIEGFEFLCGIPGTIGGALRMNAGAYGSDMSQILEEALALDPQGKLHRLTPEQLGLGYRHCSIPKDWIFIGAKIKGRKGKSDEIRSRIEEYLATREETQPVRSRTSGSTFANPEGHSAWKLIDEAGCRGLKVGGAQMSEMHCNFMINTGDASAQDLEDLGNEVKARVKTKSGIDLRWEIEKIGEINQLVIEKKVA
jgi:UDP-N-acetylmuramate dehydrogenase